MGGVCSCCGRRQGKDPEREPLLPTHNGRGVPEPSDILPKQSTINHLAAIIAAVQSGKLPSQQQLNLFVDRLLRSPLIQDLSTPSDGALSDRGRILLSDIARVLGALRSLGSHKNYDDALQYVISELRKVAPSPVRVEANVGVSGLNPLDAISTTNPTDVLPSTSELKDDANKLSKSLQELFVLLFTSSAFRILLTDILVTIRAIAADFVAEVRDIAKVVESGAQTVETIVRPSEPELGPGQTPDETEDSPELEYNRKEQAKIKVEAEQELLDTVNTSTERGKAALDNLQQQSPDRIRDTIVDRIKTIVRQAQADPRFERALQTLVRLLQSYYERALDFAGATAATAEEGLTATIEEAKVVAEAEVKVDPHLEEAMHGISKLLSRFVGGRVDTMLHTMVMALGDVQQLDSDAHGHTLAHKVQDCLGRAAKDPEWIQSAEADITLRGIYDDAWDLVKRDDTQEGKLRHDLADAIDSVQGIVDTFFSDEDVQDLASALAAFTVDSSVIAATAQPLLIDAAQRQALKANQKVRQELRRDVISFVLPRILAAIRIIPLPRVELATPMVDVVLDHLKISSLSFIPDHIAVTNWSGINVVGSDATRARNPFNTRTVGGITIPAVQVSEALTRTRLKVEGLRISADEIAYYVNAKGPMFFGWQDQGLLTLDVGSKGGVGEGLGLDVELEFGEDDVDLPESTATVFRVLDVKVDFPGLNFTITKSRHWIFNSVVLQPLLGPIVRKVLSIILAQKIKGELEKVAVALTNERGAKKNTAWWFNWIHRSFFASEQQPQEEQSDASESEDSGPGTDYQPPTITETNVTTKGIIRTSHQPATSPEQDTVIAVGIGEQVLRDVPLPSPKESGPISLAEIQRDALDELQDGVERAQDTARDVGHVALETREQLGREVQVAEQVWAKRRHEESQREGWRSKAFDISAQV